MARQGQGIGDAWFAEGGIPGANGHDFIRERKFNLATELCDLLRWWWWGSDSLEMRFESP